nr:hypothetical protein [Tanacetum cinerariifolium]
MNEPVRNAKKDFMGENVRKLEETPRPQLVKFYLKRKINKELIKGLVGNTRFNDSLLAMQSGRYGVSMPALTKDHEGNKLSTPYTVKTNTPYWKFSNIIFWKISSVVPTPRNSNTPYPILSIRRIELILNKGKKSCMETFVLNDKADYYSRIKSITIHGKNAYELRGKFLDDLHNNAFSGTNGKDAVKHIEYYLMIIDPIRLPNIYEWNENVPWVYDKPWLDNGIWKEPEPVKQNRKPFNYKTGCSKWPTCSWREDGYCNGGNFPGTYIIGNQLHYQDLEWYEALEDCELKDKALRKKSIMEGLISDNESINDY